MTQPFLGEVRLFPWDFAPRGWALCNGQQLPINQYAALFSLLGTMYGGNGVTTFALPDLRGRVPIHYGNSNYGSNFTQGEATGTESVTLLSTQIPQHAHQLVGTSATADKKGHAGNPLANDTSPKADFFAPAANLVSLDPQSLGTAGSNQPHSNMQPFLVLNYCIAMNGIFPSRN